MTRPMIVGGWRIRGSTRNAGLPSGLLLLSPLPLCRVIALVVQTDEPGGEPSLHRSTNRGSAAPAIRVATALAIARIVDALKNTPCHSTSVRALGLMGLAGVQTGRLTASSTRGLTRQ
jgi:hypothetical protein